MAKISIIGANGFLGSHLVDSLLRTGHSVTAFDRFSAGRRNFIEEPDHILVGDFLNTNDLEKAVTGQDFVVHMLSLTNPANTENSSTFDIESNLKQSVKLIELAARSEVEHFFFASSGGTIYGDQNLDRYAESDRTFPISPYGIGKLTVENYLRYFEHLHGLRSTIFRISNPYGPRQSTDRGQGIISITLNRLAQGLPAVMLGEGTMQRDYIYIDDLVSDISALINKGGGLYNLYNLGSGTGHSVREVFDLISVSLGKDFEIEMRPKPATFVEKVILDVSRINHELGQRARTTLNNGISSTIENFRNKHAD